MTKSELCQALAERTGITKRDAEKAVDVLLASISDALSQGGRVELRGFGSFGTKTRLARDGRNPKTGAVVHVPEKKTVFFKAGKELRERANR